MLATDLARRLADRAEAVCRHYLSNGRREGRYWLVGDVRNTPGRSMFVRVDGGDIGRGAAGKWTDAATGEHGDLLDVIRESCGLAHFKEVVAEAHAFLSLPQADPAPRERLHRARSTRTGSPEAARRLFAMARPISGTVAEAYLRNRGITALHDADALRFHARCYYRADDGTTQIWPALIAAVTDLDGTITGAHRTWLDPGGLAKAPVQSPRRAMGHLLGHGVRFGPVADIMAAGEGIETILSLRCVIPTLPMIAALSANHLAAILLPSTLHRLYVAHDGDRAGHRAAAILTERARAAGIEALQLSPMLGDFNEDLRILGLVRLHAVLRQQLQPDDVSRFMARSADRSPLDRRDLHQASSVRPGRATAF